MEAMVHFSESGKGALLDFARQTILSELEQTPPPKLPDIPALTQKAGCFVSIWGWDGALRSSIGNVSAVESLGESIRRNAWNAAFLDAEAAVWDSLEFAECQIEIAIVRNLRPITGVENFDPACGLVLNANGRRTVFLPWVAAMYGWSPAETLSQLCCKANLEEKQLFHSNSITLQMFDVEFLKEDLP